MQAIALEGIFTPEDSPTQKASLARLETALALVEGWVCHVVDGAAAGRLPNVVALGEAFRRRRAPAEQTFAALVGLELRPRRLREAAALWAALTEHRGIAGRDALWGHPDLLPSDDDFADPVAFAMADVDLMTELESFDFSAPGGPEEKAPGDTERPDDAEGGEAAADRRSRERCAGVSRCGRHRTAVTGCAPSRSGPDRAGPDPPGRAAGARKGSPRGRPGGVPPPEPAATRSRHSEQAGQTTLGATGRLVSGRSSLPTVSPGRSGASPATTATCS